MLRLLIRFFENFNRCKFVLSLSHFIQKFQDSLNIFWKSVSCLMHAIFTVSIIRKMLQCWVACSLCAGYNATVLAYGQTGSGKTYTMGGAYGISVDSIEDVTGIIPRVIRELYAGVNEQSAEFEFIVKISYLEVYVSALYHCICCQSQLFRPQLSRSRNIGQTKCVV